VLCCSRSWFPDPEVPRPKRMWRELVEKHCQARKLNREDAIDRSGLEEADIGWLMILIGVSG